MEHFVRTTQWVQSTGVVLPVGSTCRIRLWSGGDAEAFREAVRSRNVFSRHAGPRDFYYQRATELIDKTVVEIRDGGESSSAALATKATVAEATVFASFALHGSRREFSRRAIGTSVQSVDLHLVRGRTPTKLTPSSSRARAATGLRLDARAVSRHQKLGFAPLYEIAIGATELGGRVRAALAWLVQSRSDPSVESALVKTSTALESLLVIGREPPTRAIQERSAYLLSQDPVARARVAKATSHFYDLRGGIVHGKRASRTSDTERALEFGDRLVVLVALTLAGQSGAWTSAGHLQAFCDGARWGHQQSLARPWSKNHLRNLLAQVEGGV